ncbi:MAG TPA: CinA family protein [Salinisphaeraceae bacterium]|nr:CinA family protein [Salinisphaeraceae bacterium]
MDDIVETLAQRLLERGEMLATAESCTGGLVAAACTALAGSSAWFDRGFVTYSNAAKREALGVDAALIETHGAVSAAVVEAMLVGTLAHSAAHWAIAVSGVAGPGGGSADKPVGTVYLGWAARNSVPQARRFAFAGTRAAVREASVNAALHGLVERLG